MQQQDILPRHRPLDPELEREASRRFIEAVKGLDTHIFDDLAAEAA